VTADPSKLETASKAVPPANSLWSPRIDAIRRILDKPIDLDLHEAPLTDLRARLEQLLGIPVQFARKALDDAGLSPTAPVTYKAAGISARSALNTILSNVGLTWTIRNEALLLTSPEDDETHPIIRTYDVADLVAAHDAQGRPVDAFNSLIETITTAIRAESWSEAGGPCPISVLSHHPPRGPGAMPLVLFAKSMLLHTTHEHVTSRWATRPFSSGWKSCLAEPCCRRNAVQTRRP
jgi:hypothetical protein